MTTILANLLEEFSPRDNGLMYCQINVEGLTKGANAYPFGEMNCSCNMHAEKIVRSRI